MGEGIWIDSDKLDWDDSIGEVLKHGTLTIGFIGLAETLKALMGVHHGESEDAQALGLKIIGRMRQRCDQESEKTGLNFTLIATPAESLSGRFVALDKARYGSIPGITDRDYYTNSFHVPVYFPIKAFKKIQIEAPYHAMTNAGHITYVELDGDHCKNPKPLKASFATCTTRAWATAPSTTPWTATPSAATWASSTIAAPVAAAKKARA